MSGGTTSASSLISPLASAPWRPGVLPRVPHYRELFAELTLDPRDIGSIEDLSVLPVLDKETVRASPQRFLADDGPRVIARTTGGTTGTPLRLWATLDALRFNYAAYEARSWRWCGVRRGDRLASFHGQPIVAASVDEPPYWRRNLAFNQLYCSVYHLNERTLPAYVDELAHFGPEVITGYPSAVHRVGEHLARTGDVGRIRPNAIILAGETVSRGARADIEAGFGCRVNASYGMGELVAHVAECAEGELHVSTDYGAIELLDLDGSGRTEIVATGLINRGMPLLRYRTGDLARPAVSATRAVWTRTALHRRARRSERRRDHHPRRRERGTVATEPRVQAGGEPAPRAGSPGPSRRGGRAARGDAGLGIR